MELPSYVIKEPDSLSVLPIGRCDELLGKLDQLSGQLRLIKIPSTKVPDFCEFLLSSGLSKKFILDSKQVMITGGGAHKYAKTIEDTMHVQVVKMDEMEMLVDGLNFFVQNHVYQEIFTYNYETKQKCYIGEEMLSSFFPYLLVNIGSGVSILRVDGFGKYERVSGSSVGGGTFWGLCRLLTKVKTFDEVEQLSAAGHNPNVDLMVRDIYGSNGFESLGLGGDVIASSLGKIGSERHVNEPAEPSEYDAGDLIRSLLFMITNNTTQIAFLNAEKHNISRVIFAGGFIQKNPYVWTRLSYGINFWSKGNMEALFLAHDGYLGALGAFLCEKTEK